MDTQQVIMSLLGLACSVLGWFSREMYTAMQALRKDIFALEVRIGTDYVRYDRLQDALKPIMEGLSEIKHTLAGKVDK